MLNRTALLAPLAALLLAAAPPPPPAAASLDRLTAEHHLALRCGAVFAITASEQARGLPQANKWPALATRGREFFVRSAARIMDETGLAREDVRAAANRAHKLMSEAEMGELFKVMAWAKGVDFAEDDVLQGFVRGDRLDSL